MSDRDNDSRRSFRSKIGPYVGPAAGAALILALYAAPRETITYGERTKTSFPTPQQFIRTTVDSMLNGTALTNPVVEFLNQALDYHIAQDATLAVSKREDRKRDLLRQFAANPDSVEYIINDFAASTASAKALLHAADLYIEEHTRASEMRTR